MLLLLAIPDMCDIFVLDDVPVVALSACMIASSL